MRAESELQIALTNMRAAESLKQPLNAPGAPVRRTPLEQRAFDEGRLSMLEWVVDKPKDDQPRELKYVPMPGEV